MWLVTWKRPLPTNGMAGSGLQTGKVGRLLEISSNEPPDAGIGGAILKLIDIIRAIARYGERTGTSLGEAADAVDPVPREARILLEAVGPQGAVDGDIRTEVAGATGRGAGGGEQIQGPAVQ